MARILVYAFIMAYLVAQSVTDIKLKKVYVLPNNIAVVLTLAYYIFSLITGACKINPVTIGIAIMIWFCKTQRYYGSGDAKAMLAMFFSVLGNEAVFFLAVLVANVALLVANRRHLAWKADKNDDSMRKAFFPYLAAGYAVSLLIGLAAGVC